MRKTIIVMIFFLLPVYSSAMMCIRDSDNDRYVSEGEITGCAVNSDSESVCAWDIRICSDPVSLCPDEFSLSSSDRCEKAMNCPYSGILENNKCVKEKSWICSAETDREFPDEISCVSACTGNCYEGCINKYTLFGNECIHDLCDKGIVTDGICHTEPCGGNSNYDSANKKCFTLNPVCPTGPFDCVFYGQNYWCSPYECFVDSEVPEAGSPMQSNDYTDNGTINSSGECEGTIFIFNGKDQRCRYDGATTGWENCCDDENYLFGLMQCRDHEMKLKAKRDDGQCHEIGQYCSKDVFGACIEKSRTYCCFGGMLARIIHEQGRQQLRTDARSWGSPESPNCRGLTPPEFAMIDFTKVDLGEYSSKIQKEVDPGKQAAIIDKAQDFYNTQSSP